ncbi:hypothetical protein [Fulvivirga ligni]|uniref:hypothetical protein n=1 Tax=Fulvivirga ligni TaxID=2904246 RepID=UPI001F45E5A5|nr:hypothetical protein [Fulvivirga ligni]UII23683.1 hypothetical protein LVD16_10645 [Fulvivirga ligni]
MDTFINIALWVAMGMVVIAALASIFLPLINSLSNPKSLLKSAIGVVALLVLFLIAWAISGNEVTNTYVNFGLDATGSKLVGGCLILMWILLVIALIGVIVSEINKAIK